MVALVRHAQHPIVLCLNSLEGCHAERSEASGQRRRSQHRKRRDVRWPSRRAGIRSAQDDNHLMTSDGALRGTRASCGPRDRAALTVPFLRNRMTSSSFMLNSSDGRNGSKAGNLKNDLPDNPPDWIAECQGRCGRLSTPGLDPEVVFPHF